MLAVFLDPAFKPMSKFSAEDRASAIHFYRLEMINQRVRDEEEAQIQAVVVNQRIGRNAPRQEQVDDDPMLVETEYDASVATPQVSESMFMKYSFIAY